MLAITERPFSFDLLCGQKGIVSELKKASLNPKVPGKGFSEVMFFIGESGTGKTTLAYIVAALLNDPNPINKGTHFDPNPESPESKAILSETFNRNTSFYDASRMSKEDVLKLEEVVGSSSMFGGSTVLIVDEAQELSKTSKGIFLRLLEKKRNNAYIILCSMTPIVFGKAERSRGSVYTFRSPTVTEIATNLFNLIERKKITVPDEFIGEGLFLIAENCEGSVRMSISMLERCLKGELFNAEEIAKEFGGMTIEKLGDIMFSVIKKEQKSFEIVRNQDPKEFFFSSYRFLTDCLIFLRTGTSDAEWKNDQYQRFIGCEAQLFDLFLIYSDVERNLRTAFNSSYFFCKLSEYYRCNPIEDRVTVPVIRTR